MPAAGLLVDLCHMLLHVNVKRKERMLFTHQQTQDAFKREDIFDVLSFFTHEISCSNRLGPDQVIKTKSFLYRFSCLSVYQVTQVKPHTMCVRFIHKNAGKCATIKNVIDYFNEILFEMHRCNTAT